MERKLVQVSDVRGIDAVDGIAEAIVSVTNIVDSVNDIIMPGAYKGTLKRRNPKGVWSHDTNIPIAKTLQVEELMPGDPRLPQDLILKNAGALLVRMQFNLNTSRGRDAFHDVQFFGPEQEWSIGYAVTEGKSETGKDGIRRIKELELYEYSPVIFGAAPHTRTLSIKEDEFNEQKAKPEDVKIGDFVSWNSSGGTARGKIEYIMRDGNLGVPESSFSIDATPEDPAALIRIYKKGTDGWEETETLVGHKVSTLTKIENLKESFEIEETKAIAAIYSDIDFSIPSGVKKQAEIGLAWSKEYGRGGTSVGKNTANYLLNNETVSPDKARHIARYFPRHEGEQSLPKNNKPGSDGYPGNGVIAWKLWGGDAGRRWSEKLVDAMNSRDDEKDMHTDSPGGTPPSFGTPQRVAAQQRHPSQGRKRPAIKAEVIQEEMQDQSEETSTMSEYGRRGLSDRQIEMADYYNEVVIDFGKFDQSSGANGAHYAEENPFAEQGLICANCVFFEGGGNCHLVDGKIKPNAICKLWVIDETLLTETATAEAKSEELIETKADAGGPIASHTTPVSDRGHLTRQAILSVRSPGDKSYYRKIFAYHYPGTDGTRKTHYGFIHHHVDGDGNPGAANLVELAAEMTVLNGGRGGTKLRGEDRQKVYNHLARHYRDGGKTPPELKSDPELDNIMIKNGFISEPLTPKEQEHG